ncbi:hypothetical protein [Vibrio sp. D431a]|uniref:hypothetical protein n=1 Tax=Vibrio sp. D431a TaxID=2837388 RepID=UPI0025537649|nr:hypothetical protein [Vibrio sp. D431a]MDK9789957.1 hypothetical protein [Vibrio sp. D431a]
MNSENPYNLNTDYQELWSRLNEGQIIAAFVNYSFNGNDFIFRDICQIRMKGNEINGFVRGTNYFSLSEFDVKLCNMDKTVPDIDLKKLFILNCEALKLGWIKPY